MAQLLLGSLSLCPVVLRQWGISASSPHYVAQCLHVRVSVSHTAEDRTRRGAESWKWELPALSQGGQSSFVSQSPQSLGAGTAMICLRQLWCRRKMVSGGFCPWNLVSGRWWGYINYSHNEDRTARWNVRKENVTVPGEEESPRQKVGYARMHLHWMPLSIW